MSSSQKNQLPLSRDFTLIESPEEAHSFLSEASKTFAPTMIWTKDQEQVIHTDFGIIDLDKEQMICLAPKSFDLVQFEDQLRQSGQRECFFSVSLMRANIFFKTRYLGIAAGGLCFNLPKQLYKVQRRKDLRAPLSAELNLSADFLDPTDQANRLSKKIIDLSAGGLAILVNVNEAPKFTVGAPIKDLVFKIRDRQILTQAEVRNTRNHSTHSKITGITVGVQFKDIRPGDAQLIAGFVFEESRKYFSRFL